MSKWSKISRLGRLAILMVIAYAVMGMARPQSTSATASTASGSTEVGGPISTDTIWPLANSPYIVTKGVLIDHDVTLTIEAGVEIKINQGLGFRVDGTLIAKGTEDQRITSRQMATRCQEVGDSSILPIPVKMPCLMRMVTMLAGASYNIAA